MARNPSPLRSSKVSFEYLLLPPRSAPAVGFTRARARGFHARRGALLLDRASESRLAGDRANCRPAGPASVARSSAIHFRGRSIRQVSCYTLLSGFRLPWPPSCCLYRPTPFRGSNGRSVGHLSRTFGSSHITSSAYQKWPTWHRAFVATTTFYGRLRSGEERPVSPVPSSRVDRGRQRPRGLQSFALPDGIACRSPAGASYPEGNFGGNQLLDGSIGLSPLHPVPTIDLHVRGASDFHQSFLWLRPDRAWIAIFRVPGRLLHLSRSG